MRLLSIHVGKPKTMKAPDGEWTSAIYKDPVAGPVRLTKLNLDGDLQASPAYHGGADRALLAYSAEHYPAWRTQLGLPDLAYGAFGENFTVSGLDEKSVSLGDVFAIGHVRIQVSQPRLPCKNLARKFGRADMVKLVTDAANAGWYLRVLQEGTVKAGLDIERVERPLPDWTVARLVQAWRSGLPKADAAFLAACPYLSEDWRKKFA